MAVRRLLSGIAAHDLSADVLKDSVFRRKTDCAFRLDLEKRGAFVRNTVHDQVIEGIAFIFALKLHPLDPGIGEAARVAASEHLQEIIGAKLALNIGAGAPAPDRTGAFLFGTCAFLGGRAHRVGRLQINPAVDLRDSVNIELFRLFS